MKTIVLTNQKGGVAKTTTAYALAIGLHNQGNNVLIVDADPQSNLSFTAGIDNDDTNTLYDVLKGNCKPGDAIRHLDKWLDIMSIGLQGTAADMELASRTGREYMLKEAIEAVDATNHYTYVVVDSSPNLGLLTLNTLTAADLAIVPMSVEAYSLQGMEQLHGFFENVRKYTNPNLKVSGILLTRYNERLNITQALKSNVELAAKTMNTRIFDTKIRESVAVRETQLLRSDIYTEAPKATATIDYKAFVHEFMRKELLHSIDDIANDIDQSKKTNGGKKNGK